MARRRREPVDAHHLSIDDPLPYQPASRDERITSAKDYALEIWSIAQAGKEEDRLDIWLKAVMHYGELHGFGAGCLAPKVEESVDEDDLAEDPKALLEQMKAAVQALEKKVNRGDGA